MPITTTDVQNLINAQVSMFGMNSAYAGQMSNAFGIRSPQPLGSFAGSPVQDPRQSSMPGLGDQLGYTAAQAAAFAPTVAGFGAAAVGMLSSASFLDPFSGTLGAIRGGWGVGSSLMGRIGGAAAFGGAALGGYMALGAGANMMSNALMQGAQEQLQINMMLGMQATRSNLPLMGGLGSQGMAAMGQQIRGMAGADMWTSVSELSGLLGQGLQSGMFRGASNLGQFQAQFRQLTDSVKQVATALNTSLQEGLQTIQQFQGMGFYGVGQATGAAASAAGLAGMAGLPLGSIVGAAGMGAAGARQFGIHGAVGARLSAGLAGRLGAGQLGGVFAEADLREMAGGAPLNEAIPLIAGQLTQAAMGVGSTRLGGKLLTAMVDPETGQLDPGRVAAFEMGTLNRQQIDRMYRIGRGSRRVRAAVRSRRSSLMGSLISDIGAEGVLGNYARAELGSRGLRSGEDMEDISDILLQKFSGLGENQANLVQEFMRQGPSMRHLIQDRIKQELAANKQQLDARRTNSFEGLKRRLVDAWVEPITGPMRALGANIVNWGNEAIEGAANWLLGGGGGGATTATPGQVTSVTRDMAYRTMAGMPGGIGPGTIPEMGMAPMGGWSGSGAGGMMGLAESLTGIGPYRHQKLSAAFALTAAGTPLWSAAGRGLLGSASNTLVNAFHRSNLFSWGGIAAMGRGGLWAGGKALLGAGLKLAGPVGIAATAYDASVNILPAVAQSAGLLPRNAEITEGMAADLIAMRREGIGRTALGYATGGRVPIHGISVQQPSDPTNWFEKMGHLATSSWMDPDSEMPFYVKMKEGQELLRKLSRRASSPFGYLKDLGATSEMLGPTMDLWREIGPEILGTVRPGTGEEMAALTAARFAAEARRRGGAAGEMAKIISKDPDNVSAEALGSILHPAYMSRMDRTGRVLRDWRQVADTRESAESAFYRAVGTATFPRWTERPFDDFYSEVSGQSDFGKKFRGYGLDPNERTRRALLASYSVWRDKNPDKYAVHDIMQGVLGGSLNASQLVGILTGPDVGVTRRGIRKQAQDLYDAADNLRTSSVTGTGPGGVGLRERMARGQERLATALVETSEGVPGAFVDESTVFAKDFLSMSAQNRRRVMASKHLHPLARHLGGTAERFLTPLTQGGSLAKQQVGFLGALGADMSYVDSRLLKQLGTKGIEAGEWQSIMEATESAGIKIPEGKEEEYKQLFRDLQAGKKVGEDLAAFVTGYAGAKGAAESLPQKLMKSLNNFADKMDEIAEKLGKVTIINM